MSDTHETVPEELPGQVAYTLGAPIGIEVAASEPPKLKVGPENFRKFFREELGLGENWIRYVNYYEGAISADQIPKLLKLCEIMADNGIEFEGRLFAPVMINKKLPSQMTAEEMAHPARVSIDTFAIDKLIKRMDEIQVLKKEAASLMNGQDIHLQLSMPRFPDTVRAGFGSIAHRIDSEFKLNKITSATWYLVPDKLEYCTHVSKDEALAISSKLAERYNIHAHLSEDQETLTLSINEVLTILSIDRVKQRGFDHILSGTREHKGRIKTSKAQIVSPV